MNYSHFPLTFCLLVPALLCAGPEKVAPDLLGRPPNAKVDVIIQYVLTPQQDKLAALLNLGGTVNMQLGLINAVAVKLPVWAVKVLSNLNDVIYIISHRTGLYPLR